MPGSRNLVVFLGIGLVIVRFLTSSQRSALAGLWNTGGSTTTTVKKPTPNPVPNPNAAGFMFSSGFTGSKSGQSNPKHGGFLFSQGTGA